MPLDLARQLVARWKDPKPEHIPILRQAGIQGLILDQPDAAFQQAAKSAGIETATTDVLKDAVKTGLWPGLRTKPKDRDWVEETASASAEPWVDANGWSIAYHRAIHPNRTPVLAYEPNKDSGMTPDRYVPFETLELGLIEARMGGGNYVLALEQRYRDALLQKDDKALAAWKSLTQTAAWLDKHRALMGHPALPNITMLVDESDATQEIALLGYRRSASPRLVAASAVPAPEPTRLLALSAASLEKPTLALQKRLFAHAQAGAFVITDWKPDASLMGRWKATQKQEDRTFYSVGQGQVVVYNDKVSDPSEYSLDVIDLVTYRRRPARVWNALAAIPLATVGPNRGEAVLQVVNYGSPTREEVQARVWGQYKSATLLSPEHADQQLKTSKRGEMTEIFLPRITRASLVHFKPA